MNPAKKLVEQRWSKTTKEERSEIMSAIAKQRFKTKEESDEHMKKIQSMRKFNKKV